MGWLHNLEVAIQKDEQWVINEIRKGWAAVQNAEQKAEIDVLNIFHWIQSHQMDALNLMHTVLIDIQTAATAASAIVPQYAVPVATAVGIANTAVQAASAAINTLAHGIQQGSTPMSTLVNAYTATKATANAVNDVLKAAAASPHAS